MATDTPAPENVRLRYGSANVFERADVHSPQVGQLATDDPFVVLGTEEEFYRVSLPDGTVGFVYAHNLVGSHMPLTASEQHTADDLAAAAARPHGGWRGLLERLPGRSQGSRV
jgi:hypothetical protein